MTDLYLYNSLTKQKERFTPLQPGRVDMYHCGPTVYDYIHIGNLRAFFLADITRRTFEYFDYTVQQIMNITDVGHLVSGGDTGDDKMTKALRIKNLEITTANMLLVADEYTQFFKRDLGLLNILTPHEMPKASDHIEEDIAIIEELEKNEHIYTTSDGVYFDTASFPTYGQLAGLSETQADESRINNNEKRSSRDFALWKFDEANGWNSPWGQGFPGWHIECSGMSMKYLGASFDIHTGGKDLASVHHNNEIAQSEGSTRQTYVHYWLHNEFVNVPTGKMAKSGGTSIIMDTIIEKGFDPLAYRYWLLQGHYRSPMTFSWESLQAAQNGLQNIRNQVLPLLSHMENITDIEPDKVSREQFQSVLADDMNTPRALAVFQSVLKSPLRGEVKMATILDFDRVLGLDLHMPRQVNEEPIPEAIQHLIAQRQVMRNQKNWASADELRAELEDLGYEVVDTQNGQEIKRQPAS